MITVLPLRIPVRLRSSEAIEVQLSRWIDSNQQQKLQQQQQVNRSSSSSTECQSDLQYIAQLRNRIAVALKNGGFQTVVQQQQQTTTTTVTTTPDNTLLSTTTNTTASEHHQQQQQQEQQEKQQRRKQLNNNHHNHQDTTIPSIITDLREYAAILKKCDDYRFLPVCDDDDPNGIIHFSWRFLQNNEIGATTNTNTSNNDESNTNNNNNNDYDDDNSTSTAIIETHHNVKWERANVLWNLATLEAYRAADIVRILRKEEEELEDENIDEDNYEEHDIQRLEEKKNQPQNQNQNQNQNQQSLLRKLNKISISNKNKFIRAGWAKVRKHQQDAAYIIRYLRTDVVLPLLQQQQDPRHQQPSGVSSSLSSSSFSSSSPSSSLILSVFFLDLWDRFCTAMAQRATYETYRIAAAAADIAISSKNSTIATTTTTPSKNKNNTNIKTNANENNSHVINQSSLLLARLAAGASPLYQCVEDMCQSPETERLLNTCYVAPVTSCTTGSSNNSIDGDGRTGSTANNNNNEHNNNNNGGIVSMKLDAIVMDWEDIVRAWGMWMTAVSEYNQSIVHRTVGEYGYELSRLEAALQFGSFCKEFCDNSADSDLLDDLALQVMPTIEEMEERFEQAIQENKTIHQHDVPEHDDLPEIPPYLTVCTVEQDDTILQDPTDNDNNDNNNNNSEENKFSTSNDLLNSPESTSTAIIRLLPSSNRIRMFLSTIADPIQRKYIDSYKHEMYTIVNQYTINATKETEHGRYILSSMNLPHSLNLYKHLREQQQQQQRTRNVDTNDDEDNLPSSNNNSNSNMDTSGRSSVDLGSVVSSSSRRNNTNIVPGELWNKIEQYQLDRVDEGVQHGLQYIRQCASDAMELYQQMNDTLDEDLQLDTRFKREREGENSGGGGRSAGPGGGVGGIYRGGYAVSEIQKPFRSALRNYDRLLTAARDSDAILQRKYDEVLDRDPKFRLLKLSEQQLHRIVLPIASLHQQQQQQQRQLLYKNNKRDESTTDIDDENDNDDDDIVIDSTALSKSLVDLSLLFNIREMLIQTMKEYVRTYDILPELQQVADEIFHSPNSNNNKYELLEAEYQRIVEYHINTATTDTFYKSIQKLHDLSERQSDLIDIITKENDIFIAAWNEEQARYRNSLIKKQQKKKQRSKNKNGTAATPGLSETILATSVVVKKISDALEEVNRFAEHVKQGQEFYNSIAPKMNQLQQQINDVSSRLAADRSKYHLQAGTGRIIPASVTATAAAERGGVGVGPRLVPSSSVSPMVGSTNIYPGSSTGLGPLPPSISTTVGPSTTTSNVVINRSDYQPSLSVRSGLANTSYHVRELINPPAAQSNGSSRLLQGGRGDSFYSISSSNNSSHNNSDKAIGAGMGLSLAAQQNQQQHQQRGNDPSMGGPYGYGSGGPPNSTVAVVGYDRGGGGTSRYDRGSSVVAGGGGGGYDRGGGGGGGYDRGGGGGIPSGYDRGRGVARVNSNDGMVMYRRGGGGGGGYRDMYDDGPPPRDQGQRFQQQTNTIHGYESQPDYRGNVGGGGGLGGGSTMMIPSNGPARYSGGGSYGVPSGIRQNGSSSMYQTTPGAVDDEKVASLVAMEFDPDRVVMALRRHNNNVDQALNDLLSGA